MILNNRVIKKEEFHNFKDEIIKEVLFTLKEVGQTIEETINIDYLNEEVAFIGKNIIFENEEYSTIIEWLKEL